MTLQNAIAVRSQYETNKKKVKASELKDALTALDVTGLSKVKKADAYTALCQIISLCLSCLGLRKVVGSNLHQAGLHRRLGLQLHNLSRVISPLSPLEHSM